MRHWWPRLVPRARFGIALKLACALAAFGVLASGLTGYSLYHAARATLAQGAGDDLLLSAQVLGRRFSVATAAVATDARLIALLPDVRAILGAADAHGAARADRLENLADQFHAMLAVHPDYFQLRLIGARDHGRELVRVDRDGDALRRIAGPDLQEKAHFPYVFETLALAPSQIHYSKIFINRETGAHAGFDKPTLQVAVPVSAGDGSAPGVIVINVDLNRLFGQLKADLSSDFKLFLANRAGDYLIHPDPEKTFGFERGRHFLMQDEFAPVAAIVSSGAAHAMLGARPDQGGRAPSGSFARIPYGDAAERDFVILGLTVPLGTLLEGSDKVAEHTRRIVIGLSALTVLLSLLVARALVRPLGTLVAAVEHFSRTHEMLPLPAAGNDELGRLTRSVRQMQERLSSHLRAVSLRKEAIAHQAMHDALTGLANHAMFYELLRFALGNARRGAGELALLFIDLDHFKQVNDTGGRAAGDAVLAAAAARLRAGVRDNDVVARLSGDAFVVLLQGIDSELHLALLAQQLIDELNVPIAFQDQVLRVGASIGVAVFPRDGDRAEELLLQADAAMHQAKHDGRNRFRFHR